MTRRHSFQVSPVFSAEDKGQTCPQRLPAIHRPISTTRIFKVSNAAPGPDPDSSVNSGRSERHFVGNTESSRLGSTDANLTNLGLHEGNDSALADSIATLTDCLKAMERQILESFERKLTYDAFKEKQIERLHDELQEYKRGFADSLLLPLIQQLVRYVDQIPRHIEALRKKPAEELGPERLVKELQGVRDDLEMILENVGVAIVQSTEVNFDPRCQQGAAPNRRTIPAITELSPRGFCPDIPLTAS